MLTTTFLGHQGWQFTTKKSCILVDPLLVEPFGHGGVVGSVYPPRFLEIGKMPPVDAVILTHEHEDHFNIPSINRISRDIPIYVPRRSSGALHRFLAQIGFNVFLISAGDSVNIGDIQFRSFTPDHIKRDELDEWDTLPFAVLDLDEGANFFSSVDVTPPEAMEAALADLSATPGLWCITNNTMNLGPMDCPAGAAPNPLLLATRLLGDHARRFGHMAKPLAMVFCGSGFSLTGDRAPLNNVLFPLDSATLAAAFRTLCPQDRFIVPLPGTAITIDGGCLASGESQAQFVRALPSDCWPDRSFAIEGEEPKPFQELEAGSGKARASEQELRLLLDLLSEFARYLYGTALFRALYSIDAAKLGDIKPTFAIFAISGGEYHVFEYCPSSCEFVNLKQDTWPASHIIAIECYATDLLDVLRCRLSLSAVMFGRIRRWHAPAPDLRWALDRALWQYAHPLRHPVRYFETYMELFKAEPADVEMVRFALAEPQ